MVDPKCRYPLHDVSGRRLPVVGDVSATNLENQKQIWPLAVQFDIISSVLPKGGGTCLPLRERLGAVL